VASDLQTLRAALEAEPRDRACWAAYGDAFEDRYGQEARRALACRRVRDNAEFLALGADLDRLGVTRAEPAWPWPPGWAFCVQYRYGPPSYAALRDPIYVPRNLISHRLGTFGFLAFLQGPVRRVTWECRPGERWGCSQRQQDIEVPLHGGGTCERAPGFYASLVVASGWPGGEVPDYVAFPTKKAAKRALSLAVLNLARRKAGLPLLAPMEVFA
jgi:hypothetical protein